MLAPLVAGLALAAAFVAQPATAATSISVEIAQPGVYGRIVLGSASPYPAVIYPQPIIVTPGRYSSARSPIYLYVPAGYERNWSRYCYQYAACDQPVYFVRDSWVRDNYARHRPRAVQPVRRAQPPRHVQPPRRTQPQHRAQPPRQPRPGAHRSGNQQRPAQRSDHRR